MITTIPDTENLFIVLFSLGEFQLQGTYDLTTHTIFDISYVLPNTDNLLITGLSIPLTEENAAELAHIYNNPRLFLRLYNTPLFDEYEAIKS